MKDALVREFVIINIFWLHTKIRYIIHIKPGEFVVMWSLSDKMRCVNLCGIIGISNQCFTPMCIA